MGGCRCSYKNCKSATKTTENIHFFHYPVKNSERCRKWIENACKPQFFDLAEDQLRNKVVCELHFEQRCFTNVSRRRLLHDAIPTLDGGAEEETPPHTVYNQNIQSDEIQVLPVNDDGTLFTVDTDSFQHVPISGKVESYVYSNGSLIPLYKTEPDIIEESVVYAVEETQVEKNSKNKNGNLIFNNAEKLNQEPRTYRLVFDSYSGSEGTENVIIDEEETSNSMTGSRLEERKYIPEQDKMEVEELQPKKAKTEKVVSTKVEQRIKKHSKEIAILKKTLKSSIIQNRQKCKKSALGTLSTLLPPTLYSLVKRTVRKGELEVTEQEVELFKEIYAASPSLYSNLREKYGWSLPNADTLFEA